MHKTEYSAEKERYLMEKAAFSKESSEWQKHMRAYNKLSLAEKMEYDNLLEHTVRHERYKQACKHWYAEQMIYRDYTAAGRTTTAQQSILNQIQSLINGVGATAQVLSEQEVSFGNEVLDDIARVARMSPKERAAMLERAENPLKGFVIKRTAEFNKPKETEDEGLKDLDNFKLGG